MSFVDDSGNAERMQSKECYQTWVHTRKSPPKKPQESFRRVLTAHACGVDGRRPFPEHVEASLLKVLRRKEVWDCFKGTGVSIGIRGFRNVGYHEKLRTEEQAMKNGKAKDEKLSSKQSARSRKRAGVKEKLANKRSKTNAAAQMAAMAMPAYMQQQAFQQLNQFGAAMPFMVAPSPGMAYACQPGIQYAGAASQATPQGGMMSIPQAIQHQQMQQQMQQLLQHHGQSQQQAQQSQQQQAHQAQMAQMQAASGHPLVAYYNSQQLAAGAANPQMAMAAGGYMVPMHPGAQASAQAAQAQKSQSSPKKYSWNRMRVLSWANV